MRLRSGLLIGIFGLIVVLLGGWFFTLATALLTYLALLEFFRMAEFKGIRPATKTTLFSSFIILQNHSRLFFGIKDFIINLNTSGL